MGKRLSDAMISWRLILAICIGVLVVGCSAAGYQPPPGSNQEPIHGESGGSGGGGAGM